MYGEKEKEKNGKREKEKVRKRKQRKSEKRGTTAASVHSSSYNHTTILSYSLPSVCACVHICVFTSTGMYRHNSVLDSDCLSLRSFP